MPDRVIRDELLTSERYWRCSPEARCLYVSLLLSVDDAARYTGAAFALRTRCMAGTVSHERIDAILAELVDCDLVRRYDVGGQPYLFIPRFRNRRRYIGSSKYPEPPSEINDIAVKKSDSSQSQDGLKDGPSQTQDERGRRGVGVGVGVGVGEGKDCLVAASGSPHTRKASTKLGTRLPADWFLPDDWKEWALLVRSDWTPQGVVRESITFRDYWHAKAGKDATKVDWEATWRNWIRRCETEPTR